MGLLGINKAPINILRSLSTSASLNSWLFRAIKSSSIAGFCAQDYSLKEAVNEAIHFTSLALKNAFNIGHGQLIPDRFHWIFNNSLYEEDEDGDNPTHH
jgi:hypothetical protein